MLPADTRKTFCANFSVNAVFTYYAEEARKNEIDFDVDCPLPEHLPTHEPEICALLGNLLENAIDACKDLTDQYFLKSLYQGRFPYRRTEA